MCIDINNGYVLNFDVWSELVSLRMGMNNDEEGLFSGVVVGIDKEDDENLDRDIEIFGNEIVRMEIWVS